MGGLLLPRCAVASSHPFLYSIKISSATFRTPSSCSQLRRKGLSFSYLGSKLQYTGRFRTPYALSAKLDLVLAHQWDNALNFMYMDVLHAGYPLVHNSPYLSDCGGYYRDSDAFTAADEVDRLFNTYTGTRRELKQAARCVWRFHAYNPRIQRGWDRVVEQLIQTPLPLERKAQLDGTATAPAKEASPPGPYDATNGGWGEGWAWKSMKIYHLPRQIVFSRNAVASPSVVPVSAAQLPPFILSCSLAPLLSSSSSHLAALHFSRAGLAHFEDRPPLPRPAKRYRIALTISVAKGDLKTGSAFVNGMRQTALFLQQLLTQESRHEVVFVNLNQGTRADIPADWAFEPAFLFVNFDTALKLGLHVWIEVGIQLSQHQLNQVQAKGERVVTYRGGNDYFMAVERFVFNGSAPLPMFTTQGYDAVWTLPNFYDQSGAFLEATFNTSLVRPAPYVWHPRLWDNLATQLARRKYYAPRSNRSVIGVFESNMHLVKQAVIPLVAAELLHRRNASAFEKIVVGCSDRLLKSQEFNDLVIRGLDLYKAKRVEFSNRYRLPWYLSDNIDYVLSYQWDNALNYLHLDVLHAGYPLIHNSPYFKDCGYYYPEGEGHIAADQLDRAIKTHSGNMDAYTASAKRCLWQFHTANEDNVLGWDRLLDEVVSTPRAEHRQKELDTWVAAEEHKRGPPASPIEAHLERLRQRDEAALGEAWSTPPPRKLRVGMTTSLPPEGRAVFANGAQQTASYIWEALTYKGRHEAHLINLDLGNLSSASSDWRYKEENVSLLTFNEALDRNFDVILETGMQLSEVQLALLQVKGVKVSRSAGGRRMEREVGRGHGDSRRRRKTRFYLLIRERYFPNLISESVSSRHHSGCVLQTWKRLLYGHGVIFVRPRPCWCSWASWCVVPYHMFASLRVLHPMQKVAGPVIPSSGAHFSIRLLSALSRIRSGVDAACVYAGVFYTEGHLPGRAYCGHALFMERPLHRSSRKSQQGAAWRTGVLFSPR
jgi:hypothetical protein